MIQPKSKAAAPKKPIAAAIKSKPAQKNMAQTTLKTTKAAPKKRAKPISDEENTDHESLEDDSLLSNTPPSAKRMKKAPAPKKSTGKPLQPIDNESFGGDGAASARPKTEEYEKVCCMRVFEDLQTLTPH